MSVSVAEIVGNTRRTIQLVTIEMLCPGIFFAAAIVLAREVLVEALSATLSFAGFPRDPILIITTIIFSLCGRTTLSIRSSASDFLAFVL